MFMLCDDIWGRLVDEVTFSILAEISAGPKSNDQSEDIGASEY